MASEAEKLVASLEGWEALDLEHPAHQRAEEQRIEKAREIATAFRECFATEAGQYVLRHLMEQTVLRPTVRPESTQFGAGIREGQNDLVRQILAQIDLAKGQKG